MKKKLYFVIEKETQDVGGDFQEVTGNKSVTVYEMIDNVPTQFFTLDLVLSDDSEEAINDYLNDNGYEDEAFELIRL